MKSKHNAVSARMKEKNPPLIRLAWGTLKLNRRSVPVSGSQTVLNRKILILIELGCCMMSE